MKANKELTVFMTNEGNDGEYIEWSYDKDSNLYVNGKRLAVTDKIELRRKEFRFLAISAISLLIQTIVITIPWIKKIIEFLFAG